MEALKLVSEPQKNIKKLTSQTKVQNYSQLSEADLLKLFPLPRYFQIHFQHAHENSEKLKAELAELQHSTAQLNAKLDLLIQLLSQPRT